MTLDEAPDVMTLEEVAAVLRIGWRQAYAALHRGDIYSARIGRSIRVPRTAVVAWLEGRQNENGEPRRPQFA